MASSQKREYTLVVSRKGGSFRTSSLTSGAPDLRLWKNVPGSDISIQSVARLYLYLLQDQGMTPLSIRGDNDVFVIVYTFGSRMATFNDVTCTFSMKGLPDVLGYLRIGETYVNICTAEVKPADLYLIYRMGSTETTLWIGGSSEENNLYPSSVSNGSIVGEYYELKRLLRRRLIIHTLHVHGDLIFVSASLPA